MKSIQFSFCFYFCRFVRRFSIAFDGMHFVIYSNQFVTQCTFGCVTEFAGKYEIVETTT